MKGAVDPSLRDAAVRWTLRLGKPVGLLLFSVAVLGVLYLRFTATPAHTPSDAWPTEGYYFAGAQYQLTLQALRLELGRYHLSARNDERTVHQRDVLVLRDVLHAKYAILMDSPELRPYLQQVKGFRDVVTPLTELDVRLDAMVDQALVAPQALTLFDEQVEPLNKLVVSMVNDLRVAELGAFEAAFQAQRRAAVASQEAGLALLAVLGLGIFFHVQIRRKEEDAFRKEAEARAEAQRSAQARVALLGMVSHELRTPLQTMLGNVEMLSLSLKDADARPAIEGLERSIDLVSGQLDNIAQYTRLASGTFEVRRERFEVVPLLERIVDEHRSSAQAHGQQLALTASLDASTVVEGDPIRLHQVINNFISNAIKYGGPGSISVSASLEDAARGLPGAVVVKVEDGGPGISATEQAAIWEPFVRGRRGQGRHKGSGLGLAVVKLLADSAGWKVGVLSDTSCGAAFFVRFPLDQSNPHDQADQMAEQAIKTTSD